LSETLKVIIPMAGFGTRMRPHTWSKPKPLISVAGKPSLDHLMDMFKTLPDIWSVEYIFIISPYLGDQIRPYMSKNYPHIKTHYVKQKDMKGQSHALWLARHLLSGPTIMIFSDTLLETDFSFLTEEKSDGVAWVKEVKDPRRFGVAEINQDGGIIRLIEKPQTMENNLALVGCYYFKRGEDLVTAINEQMKRGILLKSEYFLADAINIMLDNGAQMRTNSVDVWLDTGTIKATLNTNKYMLKHGRDNSKNVAKRKGVIIVPPVFIHPTAKISNSTIGPYASIGPKCKIVQSRVEGSILEEDVLVTDTALRDSIIGNQAKILGRSADTPITVLIGDNSSIRL
jgi:glucose-1-phosphate thymidylyltransferase